VNVVKIKREAGLLKAGFIGLASVLRFYDIVFIGKINLLAGLYRHPGLLALYDLCRVSSMFKLNTLTIDTEGIKYLIWSFVAAGAIAEA
jgi:hypothetical protein